MKYRQGSARFQRARLSRFAVAPAQTGLRYTAEPQLTEDGSPVRPIPGLGGLAPAYALSPDLEIRAPLLCHRSEEAAGSCWKHKIPSGYRALSAGAAFAVCPGSDRQVCIRPAGGNRAGPTRRDWALPLRPPFFRPTHKRRKWSRCNRRPISNRSGSECRRRRSDKRPPSRVDTR